MEDWPKLTLFLLLEKFGAGIVIDKGQMIGLELGKKRLSNLRQKGTSLYKLSFIGYNKKNL